MMSFQVKSLGSNGNYQLGLSDDDDHDTWKDVIEFKEEPLIRCGGNHTIVISGSSIYSCGDNSSGQCGIPDEGSHIIGFHPVPTAKTNWTQASAGWAFSLFCNDLNEVWCCGLGLSGELGLGKDFTRSPCLAIVTQFEHKVVKMVSSLDHSIVLLDNGDVYGWGNNKKQQLLQNGDENRAHKLIYEPTKLEITGVIDVIAGRDFSLFRLLGGDNSFEYYGKDKFNIAGQLCLLPKKNEDMVVLDMKSMWSSIHLLVGINTSGSKIMSLGNNSHGQLFPGNKGMMNVDKFDIGSEHGLVVIQNIVYAWGWGEHGNCGQHNKPGRSRLEHVTFDYLNKVFPLEEDGMKIENVYCGCATSWLVLHR